MADATAETELTILVCSANVGNAEPTPESFAQWIPADGSIADPLSSTKYPVRDGLHEGAEAVAASFADATAEDKKFDIIVLGMQEAAFVDKSARYYDKSTHHLADGEATAGGGGGGGGADDVDGGGGGGGGDGTPKKKGNNVKQILRRNIKATMAAQAFMGVNKKEETTQPDSSSDRPSLTDAVNKGVDAVHRGEKKVKKRKNTIFRKADKTNLVLRGLTTSEEYKS